MTKDQPGRPVDAPPWVSSDDRPIASWDHEHEWLTNSVEDDEGTRAELRWCPRCGATEGRHVRRLQ